MDKKDRGRPQEFSDRQLKEFALRAKEINKGGKLTYSYLEKISKELTKSKNTKGLKIGRNTWKRRINDFIEQLNSPVPRTFNLTPKDTVYLPNAELLYEALGDKPEEFKNKLVELQAYYNLVSSDNEKLKRENEKLNRYKEQFEKKEEENKELKKQMYHYRQLYEELTIASTQPYLRSERNIKDNLLDFRKRLDRDADLKVLPLLFPDVSDEICAELEEKEQNEIIDQKIEVMMSVLKKDNKEE